MLLREKTGHKKEPKTEREKSHVKTVETRADGREARTVQAAERLPGMRSDLVTGSIKEQRGKCEDSCLRCKQDARVVFLRSWTGADL